MNDNKTNKLLLRVAKGDNGAFEELYTSTARGVYAFLYSYFRNTTDTEDGVQTVYLKIKQNISQYSPGNGLAWILQIAKNYALTELKRNRVSEVFDELTVPVTQSHSNGVFDTMQKVLNEEEQRIMVLHVIWGYKHREIAILLNHPTGTITSKYKRAISKMQSALKE
ncbi:MAG: sigma-70 family RNA polymerase sigma factor [Clostridia bacterium]|nr:sigma-70 family RNA polymerase sigma factor [Clostridia bacterium]